MEEFFFELHQVVSRFLAKEASFADLKEAVNFCPVCGAEDRSVTHIVGHASRVDKAVANLVVENVHPTGGIVSRQWYKANADGAALEVVRQNLAVSKKARVKII